jgi:hypothetical protein
MIIRHTLLSSIILKIALYCPSANVNLKLLNPLRVPDKELLLLIGSFSKEII